MTSGDISTKDKVRYKGLFEDSIIVVIPSLLYFRYLISVAQYLKMPVQTLFPGLES